MQTTIHRKKSPEFATKEEHDRYYGYLVVKPLALVESDILGHYRTRRAAEQAAKTMLLETPPQVMTRHEFQQLTAASAGAEATR
jgi:hypothetical protein